MRSVRGDGSTSVYDEARVNRTIAQTPQADDLAGTITVVEHVYLFWLKVNDRYIVGVGGMEGDPDLIYRNCQRIWCYFLGRRRLLCRCFHAIEQQHAQHWKANRQQQDTSEETGQAHGESLRLCADSHPGRLRS